jgi:hypothetical protein
MRPIKNKRRRDPRYFLHESIDSVDLDRDLFGDEGQDPEPPEENAPPHDMAKREELIGYLMEDGIDVNMNSHLSNQQLDAILKISRNESGAGMRGMSRNEYMWAKTAEAFPEEYKGTKNPFKE